NEIRCFVGLAVHRGVHGPAFGSRGSRRLGAAALDGYGERLALHSGLVEAFVEKDTREMEIRTPRLGALLSRSLVEIDFGRAFLVAVTADVAVLGHFASHERLRAAQHLVEVFFHLGGIVGKMMVAEA